MGSLTSRPTMQEKDWKKHSVLQACFEILTRQVMQNDTITAKVINDKIQIKNDTYTSQGDNICEALFYLDHADKGGISQ